MREKQIFAVAAGILERAGLITHSRGDVKDHQQAEAGRSGLRVLGHHAAADDGMAGLEGLQH